MYFMSVQLHIACEVNQNDSLLIHFDERGRDTYIYIDICAHTYGKDNPRKEGKYEGGPKHGRNSRAYLFKLEFLISCCLLNQ